jgi:type IV pilus assembly protein PilO
MAGLPTDPKRQKQLVLMIAPVLVLGLAWYFMYSPAKEDVERLQTRLTRIQAANREAVKQIREGEDLSEKLAVYEQHYLLLEQLIPTEQEVPELLYDMSARAQGAGVELALMRPETPIARGVYTQQTYEVSVFGGYHNVARFLTEIGSLPRIVTPIDVQVQTRRLRAGEQGTPQVDVTFRIKTYVQPPPGVVIEAPPPAARTTTRRR